MPPALGEEIAALVPHAQHRVIEAAGHTLPLEKPAALVEVLRDWLAAAPQSRR
jgi:3-oxoadipate enol-lactonase